MKGEHSRAIDMYLKVTPNSSDNTDAMANAWEKVQCMKQTIALLPSKSCIYEVEREDSHFMLFQINS